jgi:hypothetical protein
MKLFERLGAFSLQPGRRRSNQEAGAWEAGFGKRS